MLRRQETEECCPRSGARRTLSFKGPSPLESEHLVRHMMAPHPPILNRHRRPEDKPETRRKPLLGVRVPQSNTFGGKTGKMPASRGPEGDFCLSVALGRRKITKFLPRQFLPNKSSFRHRNCYILRIWKLQVPVKMIMVLPPPSLCLPLHLPTSLSLPPSLCPVSTYLPLSPYLPLSASYKMTNLEVQPGPAFLQG